MPTSDDLRQQLFALPPSQFETLVNEVRRCHKRDLVHRATMAVLEEMTTIDGMPFDEWLMNLSMTELEALKRAQSRSGS